MLEFPNVLTPSGTWTLRPAGISLAPDEDYLVLGELQTLASSPILVVKSALKTTGLRYQTHIAGIPSPDDFYKVPNATSFFSADVFAVEGTDIKVTSLDPSPAPQPQSSMAPPQKVVPQPPVVPVPSMVPPEQSVEKPAAPQVVAPPQQAPPAPPHPAAAAPQAQVTPPPLHPSVPVDDFLEALKADEKPTIPPVAPEVLPSPAGNAATSPSVPEEGAGEGFVPVKGTSLSVRGAGAVEFPQDGPLPDLESVDRAVLAKKAETRKKSVSPSAKQQSGAAKVTSGGIRLGAESANKGGDKTRPVGKNDIDESCLF